MLEPGDAWRKSSRSWPSGDCVEVRLFGHMVAMRDSRDEDGPILYFYRNSWAEFLNAIKAGELEPKPHDG